MKDSLRNRLTKSYKLEFEPDPSKRAQYYECLIQILEQQIVYLKREITKCLPPQPDSTSCSTPNETTDSPNSP